MNDERPLFILAGNGPYQNRGCEAIIRGTTTILREYFHNPEFLCISHFNNSEQYKEQVSHEYDPSIYHVSANISPNKIQNIVYQHLISYLPQKVYGKLIYRNMMPFLLKATAVLSIGGDNYSLKPRTNIPKNYTSLDMIVEQKRVPLYIWGASIGPFSAHKPTEEYMSKHLKQIDGIFARESETINYLSNIGVKSNVIPVADPAFVMEMHQPPENKMIEIPKDSIGLNFSMLMANFTTNGDIPRWREYIEKIITSLSSNLGCEIFLIPHVTIPGGDDYILMDPIMKKISPKNNVTLIPPDYNAQEIKWIISKMRTFAGARTHSTIAAFSSLVPTVCLSYSIKSTGICRDVYGNLDYCVYPKENYSETVVNTIQKAYSNAEDINRYLVQQIPIMKSRAFFAGDTLSQKLNR